MALKFLKHPGSSYVKVICDVCGGIFYRKDVTLVHDKYNYQNGQIVCFKDLDKINEQVLPNYHVDKPLSQPDFINPERADVEVRNENDDTAPSVPRNLRVIPSPINETLTLYWDGPDNPGSY